MACAVCKKCGAFGSDVCPAVVAYLSYTGAKGGRAGKGIVKMRTSAFTSETGHAARMKRILARIKEEAKT